jgi:uncharacterized RDD family membrane protein YckC
MTGPQSPDVVRHDVDDDVLVTGEAIALDLRPSGFVLNCAAGVIDLLAYGLGGNALIAYAIIPFATLIFGHDSAAITAVQLASVILVVMVIPLVVELLSHGKSLGRLATGARIVRDDGGSIGFRHAFIRSLLGVVEIFGTVGGIAALSALLTGRAKRVGDLLAGTFSQYERVAREDPPVFGVPETLVEWSSTADVGRMPDRLSRRISQFLRQAAKLTPATRARLATQLAAEAAPWVHPIPPGDPELLLAAISAMRRQRELTAHLLEAERGAHLDAALTELPHGFPSR